MTASHDLVLLHGALGASSQLDAIADVLRDRFRVHRVEFEGHGGTPARDRPWRTEHFVENVIAVLDAQGIANARFFGYSMGGYVAMYLASQHPDRVGRVATFGTKYRWDPQTARREASRLDPATIRAKVPGFAEALEARHAGADGWESVLARTAEFLRDLGDHPKLTLDVLARIRQPVRIIVGERDNTVSVEESATIAGVLQAGSVTVLPETPHPIEQVKLDVLIPVLTESLG